MSASSTLVLCCIQCWFLASLCIAVVPFSQQPTTRGTILLAAGWLLAAAAGSQGWPALQLLLHQAHLVPVAQQDERQLCAVV
jgi:hypothetical protein